MLGNIARVIAKVRERGFRFFYTYAREIALFDLTRRTNTSLRKTETNAVNGIYYVASFTSVVRTCISTVRNAICYDFTRYRFVDVGCGKGKGLLLYLEDNPDASFNALGIEADPDLCRVAERNLRRRRLGDKATVVCDLAENIKTHVGDEPLLVYAYNPFTGNIFASLLDALADRNHILIYVDPVERIMLGERGYEIVEQHVGRYHADTWLIARLNRTF